LGGAVIYYYKCKNKIGLVQWVLEKINYYKEGDKYVRLKID